MPTVSICIPAYKEPRFFRRALESVAAQDYTDYEVIVTDDSPDSSVENEVAAVPIRAPLRYLRNNPALGVPGNWNKGVALAGGRYVKLLHQDDWFLTSDSLAQFVRLMDTCPGAALGFSSAKAYNPSEELRFVHEPAAAKLRALRRNRNVLFFGNFIGPPSSIIYRREKNLAFDGHLKWLVDVDFYLRLLTPSNEFAYTSTPLVGVTVEGAHQLTRQCENNREVEVYERLYVYANLTNRWRLLPASLSFFGGLFKRMSVTSSAELLRLARGVHVPRHLRMLLLFT